MTSIELTRSFRIADKWYRGPVLANEESLCCIIRRMNGRCLTRKNSHVYFINQFLWLVAPHVTVRMWREFDASQPLPSMFRPQPQANVQKQLERSFPQAVPYCEMYGCQVVLLLKSQLPALSKRGWSVGCEVDQVPWRLNGGVFGLRALRAKLSSLGWSQDG